MGRNCYKGTPNYYLGSNMVRELAENVENNCSQWGNFFRKNWRFAASEFLVVTLALNSRLAHTVIPSTYKDGEVPVRWDRFPFANGKMGVDVNRHGRCLYPELGERRGTFAYYARPC